MQISCLIVCNLAAPTPVTRARSSTFLNAPIAFRCSIIVWAIFLVIPVKVISSSSVAVFTSSRATYIFYKWFTILIKNVKFNVNHTSNLLNDILKAALKWLSFSAFERIEDPLTLGKRLAILALPKLFLAGCFLVTPSK